MHCRKNEADKSHSAVQKNEHNAACGECAYNAANYMRARRPLRVSVLGVFVAVSFAAARGGPSFPHAHLSGVPRSL